MIVVAPLCVAATTASIRATVPFLKFSNSNTPGGLKKEVIHVRPQYYGCQVKVILKISG